MKARAKLTKHLLDRHGVRVFSSEEQYQIAKSRRLYLTDAQVQCLVHDLRVYDAMCAFRIAACRQTVELSRNVFYVDEAAR